MTITKKEVNALMTIIQRAYPSFYSKMNAQSKKAVLDLWQEMLDGEEAEKVALSVRAIIETDKSGFPPTIGMIKRKLHELFDSRDMNEFEAWSLVDKARKNAIYHNQEEFEKLPPVVQRAVGCPDTLKEWASVGDKTDLNVIATGFRRRYKEELDIEKEYRVLSPTVKEIVKRAKNGEALGDGAKKLLISGTDTVSVKGDM